MTRGRQIAECDLARRMAVETLFAEREAIDTTDASPRPSFWARVFGRTESP